jgi:Family of unknown function (DUF6338)
LNELLTPEKLGMFLVFAVPGIIALYFRSQFLTGRLPPLGEGVIAYVILSLVYQALCYPLSKYLLDPAWGGSWRWPSWFVFIFVVPAIIGLLLGINIRKGWLKGLVNKFGFSTIHPVNCAWDWRFGQCEECWVIVVLKDGTKWYGYLGTGSFMSSASGERDLFVEAVYEFGTPWTPRSSSVWIAHGEVQSLEFLPK